MAWSPSPTGTALTNLQLVASNDNWQPGDGTSRVYFPVTASTVYSLMVDTGSGDGPGTIQLSIRLTQPSQILANTVLRLPDGSVSFKVANGPGPVHQLQVQVSTNLIDWTTSPAPVASDGTFTDTAAAPAPHRFYRAIDSD